MPHQSTEEFVEELHRLVQSTAEIIEFGDHGYRKGMHELINAYDSDCTVEDAGWDNIQNSMLNNLKGRIYAQRGFSQHPDVLAISIQRPIVIVGLPRTGTTALHRLLSQDEQFQTLAPWIAARPMPRPARDSWDQRKEFLECVERVEQLNRRSPTFRRIHEFIADEPEECGAALAHCFARWNWGVVLPTYSQWLCGQDLTPSYRYYLDVLRLVGCMEAGKTWLLKDPFHIHDLDSLLAVAPNACLIQTHRDPIVAIPSWYSLVQAGQLNSGIKSKPHVCLASQLCSFWSSSLERARVVRQRAPGNFFDVDHREFVADPLHTIKAIYEHLGLVLTPETEYRMRQWTRDSPTTRHGRHRYDLTSFHTSSEKLRELFVHYRAEREFN